MGSTIILKMAMTPSLVVGNSNNPPYCLPWGPKDLPGELKLFREVTKGYVVVMGRVTANTLPSALPGRENVVITRSAWEKFGFSTFNSLEDAIKHLTQKKYKKIFIIGGSNLAEYALRKNLIDEMQLTITVKDHFEGNVYFPKWNPQEWRITKRQAGTDEDGCKIYSVITYRRKR